MALKKAIAHPPKQVARPASLLAGYSGTPLPKKLGIKPEAIVTLVAAPADFRRTLGEVPPGVEFAVATLADSKRLVSKAQPREAGGSKTSRPALTLFFPGSCAELARAIDAIVLFAKCGPVWIAWPKKASGVVTDLTEKEVRATGLDAGLVDYKVCAIDATWSGLLFAGRKPGGKRKD